MNDCEHCGAPTERRYCSAECRRADKTGDDVAQPLPLLIGGVLRCCIQTYERTAPAAADTNDGDVLPCAHCNSRLIVQAGYWGWDRDYDLAKENAE